MQSEAEIKEQFAAAIARAESLNLSAYAVATIAAVYLGRMADSRAKDAAVRSADRDTRRADLQGSATQPEADPVKGHDSSVPRDLSTQTQRRALSEGS
jgi:hypothetical protein